MQHPFPSMHAAQLIFTQLTNRSSCRADTVSNRFSDRVNAGGLFANKACPSGSIVFEEYPIGATAVAFFWHARQYCANCAKPLFPDSCIACPNNCEDRYCSSACRERAFELYHHTLCTATNEPFSQYHQSALQACNEYYLVAARLLVMFPNAPWLFHFECTPEDHDLDCEHMSRLLRQAIRVKTETAAISSATLSRTIAMLRVNVLGLRHDDLSVGFALYSTQSLMNHSDTPNCRCVTICGDSRPDNPCLCGIEALTDIQPDEELTIDYLPHLPCEERIRVLREQYGIG